jgi:ABC-type phosphate transport system substrate-binding protein
MFTPLTRRAASIGLPMNTKGKGARMDRLSVSNGVFATRRWGLALAALLGTLVLGVSFAQLAPAKGGGQVGEAWGTPGTANGQLYNPAMFGADTGNGNVYVGDYNGEVSKEATEFRIQQLTESGEFKAAATIPRFPVAKKAIGLQGIAVDPGLGRFYVVESCRVAPASGKFTCKESGGVFAARNVIAYSTTPSGTSLVKTGTFPLPAGEEELYGPTGIAVDPSNHDILILAEEAAEHLVVQRLSSAGVLGKRVTDTTDKLKPLGGGEASSLAVSNIGVAYTITGQQSPGAKSTRAWQVPSSMASIEAVPGFAASAEKENWPAGHESFVEPNFGGPQLAISADGGTLYWKEVRAKSGGPTEPGDLLVRGYSLSKGETTAIWGGGSSKCKITTSASPLAATSGGNLAVLDSGAETTKPGNKPAYGLKEMTFGTGGTGCVEPIAKFTINGKKEGEEPTGIKPGDTVTFNASTSELAGGFRKEVIWKFGDGSEKVVTEPKEGEEAPATVTHVYSSAAKVTVGVEIKLAKPFYGDPATARSFDVGTPVEESFELTVSKTGTGGGEVTSSPAGINCGATCSAKFAKGKVVTLSQSAEVGSEFKGWTGCESEEESGKKCKVTMSAAKSVSAKFDATTNFNLKVNKTGSGWGPVVSTPVGIDCHAICEASFAAGTPVTLAGTPGPDSKLTWSGCDKSVGSNECEVEMSGAREITASFDELACSGANIAAAGSSLQAVAQTEIWKTGFEGTICNTKTHPTVTYSSTGSAAGMREWNFDGSKGSINTGLAFVGTDAAPTAAQIANIKSVAGGAQVAVIPVAQTAIAIVANLPTGCPLEGISNSNLAGVFEGRIANWSKVQGSEGTCNSPITRVVRKDGSGTTLQLKNYLYQLYKGGLPCTVEGKQTWQDLEPIGTTDAPNTSWPETCEGKVLSSVVRAAGNGGAEEVKKVNTTAGSIGYAALPDAKANATGTTTILGLQNNGQKSEVNLAKAAVGSSANCGGVSYTGFKLGGSRDVDWSSVFGGKPAIGGKSYPLCALTYVLAFHGYGAAGFGESTERTVRDYLNGYVVQEAGQAAIDNSHYYGVLPTSGEERFDVLGAARRAASSISF